MLVDACWAISYICEPPERIGHLVTTLGPTPAAVLSLPDLGPHPPLSSPGVSRASLCSLTSLRLEPHCGKLATGVLPMLVGLLSHASPNVQTPALRCVGNVAIGSPEETAAVLECGALVVRVAAPPTFHPYLHHTHGLLLASQLGLSKASGEGHSSKHAHVHVHVHVQHLLHVHGYAQYAHVQHVHAHQHAAFMFIRMCIYLCPLRSAHTPSEELLGLTGPD